MMSSSFTSRSVPSSSLGSHPSRSVTSRSHFSVDNLATHVDIGKLEVMRSIECGDIIVSMDVVDAKTVVVGLASGSLKVLNLLDSPKMVSIGTDLMPLTRLKCKSETNGMTSSLSATSSVDDMMNNELEESRIMHSKVKANASDVLLASTHAGGHLRLWDLTTCLGSVSDPCVDNIDYMCVDHSPWVDLVCVGASSGQLRVVDTSHLSVVSIMEAAGVESDDKEDKSVQCVLHHPTHPHEFVSVSNDQVLRVWDLREQYCVRSMHLDCIVAGNALVFDEDDNRIVVATFNPNCNLSLVDYKAGKTVKLVNDKNFVNKLSNTCLTSIDKVRDSVVVVGGCHSGSVHVVDYNKDKLIAHREFGAVLDVKCLPLDEHQPHHQGRQRTTRMMLLADQSKLLLLELTL